MRESCLSCVLKHLAEATILMIEAKLGYPWHRYYAIGHMAEAEAESLADFPEIAHRIRELRLDYMSGKHIDMDVLIDWVAGIYEDKMKHEGEENESNAK